MNSHGLLAQEDGAEVEIQTRNATETEDDPEHLTGGEENQPDEEPAAEDSSESESELQRTLDELKRQVRHERKAAIKAEKDRLMTELAELKNRNAPSSKKNGSPRRRIGAPTAVKVVRGGGKARASGGRPNSNKSKKSPSRHVKTQHVTIDNLWSLHELSELADSELADLGLNQPAEQEPESDEDPGTDCFQNVNMNRTRYERQACPDVSNLYAELLRSQVADFGTNSGTGLKSGIKDRVSDLVKTRLVYAHMGLPFEHSRQGRIAFHDLDYPLFVEGELGVIMDENMHVANGEMLGRLSLLQKISHMQGIYEWSAVRDFYASVLHKIERGEISWDLLDLPALELSVMSRASLLSASRSKIGNKTNTYTGPQQQKGTNLGAGNANVESKFRNGGAQAVFFCSPYQWEKCWFDGPHPGNYNGRSVTRLHICATCWQKDRKQNPHPEISTECPYQGKKWLELPELYVDWLVWANQAINSSGEPNYLGVQIPAVSKLNIPFLKSHCHRSDDELTIKFLQYGCPIGVDKSVKLSTKPVSNHKGAREFPEQINAYLSKECQLGACLGPLQESPFTQPCHISPINSVEKRGSSDRRVIVDLSFPKNGGSVNSAIRNELIAEEAITLRYPTIDNLVDLVVRKGRGCALMKRDLSRAYRQIPVDMGDIHLLGYRWQGSLYFDLALPMGMKSSALFCQRVSNLIRHILQDEGYDIVNYLDDFGGAETWDRAEEAFVALGEVLEKSGLGDAVEKRVPPCCIMVFLGIQFNSIDFTLSIDEDRLEEIQKLLDEWLNRSRCTRHDLQSLLGKLNFVAACVRPGRLFTMRLLALLRQTPLNGSVPIPRDTKADLRWWKRFLVTYNGVSIMPESPWSEPDEILSTDACLEGCGGWFLGRYFHAQFPEKLCSQKLHINALELVTIMVAVRLWAPHFHGRRMTILCDNASSVQVLNKGVTKDGFQANCLREIAFMASKNEFSIRARHVPGVENRIPDLRSRWESTAQAELKLRELTKGYWLIKEKITEEIFYFTYTW